MFRRPPFFFAPVLRSARILTAVVALSPFLNRPAEAHGSHDELIGELLLELRERPNDPNLLLRMAAANCEHGDWDIALSYLDMVERLAPGQLRTDVVRGQSLYVGGKFREAVASLDKALDKEPGNLRARLFRARAHAALGQIESSLLDYRELSAETAQPEPSIVREVAKALTKWNRIPAAIEVLADCIAKIGPEPSLVLQAMELEVATGHFEAALSRVEAMEKTAPQPEIWMSQRAQLLERAGRGEEAQTAWKGLLSHLEKLPSLERGSREMSQLAAQAQQAIGAITPLSPVIAPPAKQISSASTLLP